MANPLHRSQGFAFVELLVVAAVVAMLVAILLPQIGHARKVSRQQRESSACGSASEGHALYMNEYKDAPIVGYSHWNWGHPYNGQDPQQRRIMMFPPSFDKPNQFYEGSAIKFHGLRFRGFVGLSPDAWQIDRNFLATISTRRDGSDSAINQGTFGPYTSPTPAHFAGAIAVHPSWGLNTTYVGGDYLHGAFTSAGAPGVANPATGEFYLTRLDKTINPSKLIFMASSRAADVNTWSGAWYNAGTSDADGQGQPNRIRPGYYKIKSPQRTPEGIGSTSASGGGWGTLNGAAENNTWDATRTPSYFGYLDGRHFGKPVVAHLDGHIEMLSLEQLRDMTRWSNYATERNWTWRRR